MDELAVWTFSQMLRNSCIGEWLQNADKKAEQNFVNASLVTLYYFNILEG